MTYQPPTSAGTPIGNDLSAAQSGVFAQLRANNHAVAPTPVPTGYFVLAEVEQFRELSRSLGYSAANRLIEQVRAAVAGALPGCEVGRAGRNSLEFVFAAASQDEARGCLMALTAPVAGAINVDGVPLDLPLRMGIAPIGADNVTDATIELAEQALAEARTRHLRLVFASADGTSAVAERLELIGALHHAIVHDQLVLHYQPKLRSRTGEIDAAEALIRWQHPTRGLLAPDTFVPLAEETGNIRTLTQWVILRALRDHVHLRSTQGALRLDVNISGRLIADPDFTAWVIAHLADFRGAIGFEITETAMISDPDRALSNLTTFAELGIRLAIDDYGSGFSSLSYLQRLPVHELKLDKGFISKIAATSRDPLLVRSTIDLAHALDMEVTAEGVDTPEALALLQVMGCDLLQGYLIARPMPLEDLERFISRDSERDSLAALRDLGTTRRLVAR